MVKDLLPGTPLHGKRGGAWQTLPIKVEDARVCVTASSQGGAKKCLDKRKFQNSTLLPMAVRGRLCAPFAVFTLAAFALDVSRSRGFRSWVMSVYVQSPKSCMSLSFQSAFVSHSVHGGFISLATSSICMTVKRVLEERRPETQPARRMPLPCPRLTHGSARADVDRGVKADSFT